jgi:type IV pilus assembly protein PilP
MDWRKPEAWPQAVQRASYFLALGLGFVVLSPVWLSAWQDWRAADIAVQEMQALLEDTQTLGRQTIEMQASSGREALAFKGASEISHLSHLNALKPTAVSMGRATHSTPTDTLQVQLWPIHLHAAGSWESWTGWLAQWPTAMPGVTVSSLDLQADAQGGVTVQLGLLSPRLLAPVIPATSVIQPDKAAQATAPSHDPFDAKAWHLAQVQHAQQHPSYAKHVVPEMQRTRQTLENFPRHQLRYVGHLSSGAELQALVQVAATDSQASVASPQVHRVQVGDRLGQDFGHVLRVEKHQIRLRELTADPRGEWQMRQVVMPLEVSP